MCHSLSEEEEKDPEASISAVHIAQATTDLEMHMLFCCLNFPLEEKKKIKEEKRLVSQNCLTKLSKFYGTTN